MKKTILCVTLGALFSNFAMAETETTAAPAADSSTAPAAAPAKKEPVLDKNGKEVQDMSDPLAVFTQAGLGFTNKGVNLKIGQTYDTGNPETAGMNIIELKGILGEAVGWDSNSARDNSIDSFRWRNFSVLLPKGRATQFDLSYSVEQSLVADQTLNASYSYIQALPKLWRINLYPLAGVGAAIGKDAIDDIKDVDQKTGVMQCYASHGSASSCDVDNGYSMMGVYGLVGMYSKFTITDKMWLNYNPFWLSTIAGSDVYEDNAYGLGESHILTHEFAASYQFTPRFNMRYFANWDENTDFMDGDHRIEFNYQF